MKGVATKPWPDENRRLIEGLTKENVFLRTTLESLLERMTSVRVVSDVAVVAGMVLNELQGTNVF